MFLPALANSVLFPHYAQQQFAQVALLVDPSSLGNEKYKPQFCEKCNEMKPPRAHHCSACNRCVLRMDHHCPWVDGCVGKSLFLATPCPHPPTLIYFPFHVANVCLPHKKHWLPHNRSSVSRLLQLQVLCAVSFLYVTCRLGLDLARLWTDNILLPTPSVSPGFNISLLSWGDGTPDLSFPFLQPLRMPSTLVRRSRQHCLLAACWSHNTTSCFFFLRFGLIYPVRFRYTTSALLLMARPQSKIIACALPGITAHTQWGKSRSSLSSSFFASQIKIIVFQYPLYDLGAVPNLYEIFGPLVVWYPYFYNM